MAKQGETSNKKGKASKEANKSELGIQAKNFVFNISTWDKPNQIAPLKTPIFTNNGTTTKGRIPFFVIREKPLIAKPIPLKKSANIEKPKHHYNERNIQHWINQIILIKMH